MGDSDEDPIQDSFLARLTRKVMGGVRISESLRRPPRFRIGRRTLTDRQSASHTLRTTAVFAAALLAGWLGLGLLEGWTRLIVPACGALFFLGYRRFEARIKRPPRDRDAAERARPDRKSHHGDSI